MYSQENISDGVLFGTVADMRTYSFIKKGIHHRCFPVKFMNFYRASFHQNTAGRLLLISSNILDVSLALSAINLLSHSKLSKTS